MAYTIGIDLGGTSVKLGVFTPEGKLIAWDEVAVVQLTAQEIVERIAALVEGLLRGNDIVWGAVTNVGMGIPGAFNYTTRLLEHCGNLPLAGYPLIQELEDRWQKTIIVENDANVAAWGEYLWGGGQGCRNMLYVTVSTGIGAGAVVQGELYTGSHGTALELGHMSVDYDGISCSCGNRGCLERYASGRGIAERYGEGLDTTAIFAATDTKAQEVIAEAIEALGTGLASIANILAPEIIVIGGGVALHQEAYITKAEEVMRERTLPTVSKNLRVVRAQLGAQAGLYGAGFLKKCNKYSTIR